MKEYRIILEPQFKEELDSILYLFPHSNATRKKLHTEIRNTVLSLEIFPERYHKIGETKNIQDYILHIFSQKQDYLNQI